MFFAKYECQKIVKLIVHLDNYDFFVRLVLYLQIINVNKESK